MTLYEQVAKTIMKLLIRDPYYALFLMGVDKQETTRVPTLAVGLNGIDIRLLINKEFWETLSDEYKYGIIMHEALHICYFHLLDISDYPDHAIDNIACDMEINQFIPKNLLPKECIWLEDFQEKYPQLGLEPLQGRRYYYNKLKSLPEEEQQKLGSQLGNNEHFWEAFEELSESDKEVIRNQVSYMMEETANECRKQQGTVPGNLEQIMKLNKKEPPKFDWKKYIRQWVGMSQDIYFKPTRFKPNPYFARNPSQKVKFKQQLLVAIDTSGSVSNDELQEFMSEIKHLYKFGHSIYIMCVDTHIYEPYLYKGVDDFKISGRGGTYFTPTLNYFNAHPEYSCMIYFTDGEAELPPNSNRPMLWVISSRGTDKYIKKHNGKILKITK